MAIVNADTKNQEENKLPEVDNTVHVEFYLRKPYAGASEMYTTQWKGKAIWFSRSDMIYEWAEKNNVAFTFMD